MGFIFSIIGGLIKAVFGLIGLGVKVVFGLIGVGIKVVSGLIGTGIKAFLASFRLATSVIFSRVWLKLLLFMMLGGGVLWLAYSVMNIM